MKIIDTEFKGLKIIENNRIKDDRGWFEKKFHQELLKGITGSVGESYVSKSSKGVLRGLHFQTGKSAQSKLVTCLSGSFIDIAIDLRKEEPSFGKVFMYEVDSRKSASVFVPGEFAHGIYVLEDDTVLLNYASTVYSPGCEGGINYQSVLELRFISNPIVSEKDRVLPTIEQVLSAI
jgi:dTDP-4-dehydrorhamnose 3,5-epimerase